MTRREFITALEAIGMSAALDVCNWSAAAEESASARRPVKVDVLEGRPALVVAHCCDPQLGFGIADSPDEAYKQDLQRLTREIELVNEQKPDLVVFAGDMTHRWQEIDRDWPALLERLDAPVLVAPGNHDIPDPVKASGIENFVRVFKKEYDSLTIKDWKIIAINSQYCRPTEEKEAYEKQVEWFRRELESAADAGLKSIVVSHVPPFSKKLDEENAYFNFPTEFRRSYLDYLVANGVTFYLAGHTHTTLERDYRGLPLLNGETTSRNFDRHDFGFRMLKVDDDLRYVWDFVEVQKNA